MSVFPISGPGLALGTSSSKKRSVGAEASGAPGRPVAVPRAGGGCWGAARSRPRKRGCSAPQRTQRRTSLCYARKPRLARGRTRIQPKPIQSTATARGPPQRDSPERVSELATLPYLRPELGGWLRAVPGACSTGSVSGSGRAPAAATAVPGGRLGMLRAGALPGAAPPARWARASPPLSI